MAESITKFIYKINSRHETLSKYSSICTADILLGKMATTVIIDATFIQGDQIGHLFTNWATFERMKCPKNGYKFWLLFTSEIIIHFDLENAETRMTGKSHAYLKLKENKVFKF